MDGYRGYYATWNKSNWEDKYIMISLICGIKEKQREKPKVKHIDRFREETDGCQRGEGWAK